MSVVYLYVKIDSVGSGDDSLIGMKDGSIQWRSSTLTTDWFTGFIDRNTVDGIMASCNIAQGGTLGGFEGDISFRATSSDLVESLIQKTIDVIGKGLEISVGHSSTPSQRTVRYTGRVSTWRMLDEITVEFTCKPVTEYNKRVIPSVTVNEELALGISDSSAIGKSVTETYGNICSFPLIYLDGVKGYNPLIAYEDTGDYAITSSNASPNGMNISGIFIGKSLFQVLAVYQAAANGYLWIALSYNGIPLFNALAEAEIGSIKRAFLGGVFKIVSGTGSDDQYKVIDAVWASRTISSVTTATVWFKINTTDINAVKGINGYTNTFNSVVRANKEIAFSKRTGDTASNFFTDEYPDYKNPFNTDFVTEQDISFVVFSGVNNLFLVSSLATLEDCSIVSSNGEFEIPNTGIEVVSEGDGYKLIRINTPNTIEDTEPSFSFLKTSEVSTKFLEYNGDINEMGYILYPSHQYSDGVFDSQSIGVPFTKSESGTANIAGSRFYFINVLKVAITEIEKGLDSVVVIPKFKYEVDSPDAIFNDAGIEIEVSVVSEGNLVLGSKVFYTKLNQLGTSDGGYFDLRVEDGVVWISNFGASDYDSVSAPLFNSIKSALDIADLLKNVYDNARYMLVRITFDIDMANPAANRDYTITKTIDKVYVGTAKKVDKDKLYLKSVNTSTYTVNSPATLARQVALENGLTINGGSFNGVDTIMRTLFDGAIEDFDGQIQPNNKTTVASALMEIAQSSMMALYMTPTNVLKAKWFADDNPDDTTPVYSFSGDDVVKGSMRVTKPQNGYRYTDFVFDVKKKVNDTQDSVFINTDSEIGADDFPSTGDRFEGELLDFDSDWIIEKVAQSPGSYGVILKVTRPSTYPHPVTKFCQGMVVESFDPDVSSTGPLFAISAVVYNFNEALGNNAVSICLDRIGGLPIVDFTAFGSLRIRGLSTTWKDYVSGTFISNYTTARNIWEHAQEARLALGSEFSMPSQTTTLLNPIWGSDIRALTQWILYTVVFCTREKTLIEFRAPMNADTLALWLMDYVEFSWGPYALFPTFGWIVEVEDDYASGEIIFKILTSVSDSDVLILDETTAVFETVVDETDETSTTNFDEGALV